MPITSHKLPERIHPYPTQPTYAYLQFQAEITCWSFEYLITSLCLERCIVGLVLGGGGATLTHHHSCIYKVASSPGPSHILSRSRGEKSGEGLGSLLHNGPEMVDTVSTN